MALKVTIELSAINYVRLAYGCPIGSRAYAILSKGSFVRRQKDDSSERVFEILCDVDEAQELHNYALGIDSNAAFQIMTSAGMQLESKK